MWPLPAPTAPSLGACGFSGEGPFTNQQPEFLSSRNCGGSERHVRGQGRQAPQQELPSPQPPLCPAAIRQRPCEHVAPTKRGGRLGWDQPAGRPAGTSRLAGARRERLPPKPSQPTSRDAAPASLAAGRHLAAARSGRACGWPGDGKAALTFAGGHPSCLCGRPAQHVPPLGARPWVSRPGSCCLPPGTLGCSGLTSSLGVMSGPPP
ncbi:unnamed protein product [Rangifer tarandus platyrhynchus]|uniref:Uncharacterized protein n=1 Tax=Rangifer tarandus platyrhynchus TaxID=3082113 RepID=A0AC59ZB58_RANTA